MILRRVCSPFAPTGRPSCEGETVMHLHGCRNSLVGRIYSTMSVLRPRFEGWRNMPVRTRPTVPRTQLGRPVGASGEETRQRIIVATMKCVAEVGYSKATIREIARAADVTSATLYNYFRNKSELIKATIAARADASMPRVRKAAERPGDVIDRIEAVLDE